MTSALTTAVRVAAGTLVVAGCTTLACPEAHADADAAPASARWLALGVLGGSTLLDAGLADYRWEVAPRGAWGAQALAGAGALALGTRLWRTATSQRFGIEGAAVAADVHATSAELVGQVRVAALGRTELFASASAGRMHVGYHPDRLEVPSGVAGSTIGIELAPVDAWTYGGGIGMRHPVRGPWAVGLEVDRRGYGWDAAHRAGDRIEVRRESFGDWNAHLELAWIAGRR